MSPHEMPAAPDRSSETARETTPDDRSDSTEARRRTPRDALMSVRRATRRAIETVAVRGRRLEVRVERRVVRTLIRVTGELSQGAAAVRERLDALRDRLEAAQERSMAAKGADGAGLDRAPENTPLPGTV